VADKQRQIIAIGGGGFHRDSENLALEKYVIQQTGVESPRVAFVPAASRSAALRITGCWQAARSPRGSPSKTGRARTSSAASFIA